MPFTKAQIALSNLYSTFTLDNILDFIHLEWHPTERKDRFPTVAERVKIYMSNWYSPPCDNSTRLEYRIEYNGSYPTLKVLNAENKEQDTYESIIDNHKALILHRPLLEQCSKNNFTEPRMKKVILRYCNDTLLIMDIGDKLSKSWFPYVTVFGDVVFRSRTVPIFAKCRYKTTRDNLAKVTTVSTSSSVMTPCVDVNQKNRYLNVSMSETKSYRDNLQSFQPIVWIHNYGRHFGVVLQEARTSDMPWESKKLGALWIGFMTGSQITREDVTPLDRCLSNQRCRFVYQHANSSLIKARISNSYQFKRGELINGVNIFADEEKKGGEFLKFKAVISFEGNDISSGLKWQLLSNSVVLMPPPKLTSWLMEELLEPWVHYIPLNEDGSNAEEMLKWIGDHDREANKIAERATLFMYDLLYHADAKKEDQEVKKQIVERYQQFWKRSHDKTNLSAKKNVV